MTETRHPTSRSNCSLPKWFAHIRDTIIAAPKQVVQVSVLKMQASIHESHSLVRDHNSPNDVILKDDQMVDLSEGNVFYTLEKCNVLARGHCLEEAKLAYCVDDRVETTIRHEQTGSSMRAWFGIDSSRILLRDRESPDDDIIEDDTVLQFRDGPVFVTRQSKKEEIIITVCNEDDGREFQLRGQKNTPLAELIAKIYSQLGVPRRDDDRLRCEGGSDVLPYATLTLGQYVEAGHCKCLVWLFAGGTGGASCQ